MRTVKQYNLNQCGERKPDDVWGLPLFFNGEPNRASRKRFSKKKGLEGAADGKNEEQGNKQAYKDLSCLY